MFCVVSSIVGFVGSAEWSASMLFSNVVHSHRLSRRDTLIAAYVHNIFFEQSFLFQKQNEWNFLVSIQENSLKRKHSRHFAHSLMIELQQTNSVGKETGEEYFQGVPCLETVRRRVKRTWTILRNTQPGLSTSRRTLLEMKLTFPWNKRCLCSHRSWK